MLWKPMLAAVLATAVALFAGGALAQSGKPDSASKSFIKSAIEANYSEIDIGKLAQDKGKSDAVKQYGKMLVEDHSAANQKAIAVAKELGVSPPSGSSIVEKGTYAKLKMLSGASFDESFAKSMVSDHEADIKDFEKESAKPDAAGRFAKEALPTLRKHLQEAQTLQQQTQTTGSK